MELLSFEAATPMAAVAPEEMDTAMLLAAALPPSVRTTAEEAPAAYEVVVEAAPAMPAEAPAVVEEDGMDVDMDAAEPEAEMVEVAATAVATPVSTPTAAVKGTQFDPCVVCKARGPPCLFCSIILFPS